MTAAIVVDVWLFEAPETMSAATAARCEALLSPDERARGARYRGAGDRARHLAAHALARAALSTTAPLIAPAAWRFVTNAHGRPEVAPEQLAGAPRFNLSHTHGLVACAVARDREVGVDVEHTEPKTLDLEVARAVFAPAEVDAIVALPEAERRARFFAIWTLKESYIKARGLGLALPLQKFAFTPDGPNDEGGALLEIAPELADDAASWLFTRARPTPRHALALAVRRAPGEAISVRYRRAADLFGDT
ncbi:MAG TPA: 4'-phosphopantetheinyl transferase superfamily protein [Polyangia bacterium]|nr:4'-phosphopantetheinyl transferase superfamily protein [Polyangia bacterium]